jgi:putative nucleotidyltransferase with HDIG domain
MGLFEILGWKRRTPPPVGEDLERGTRSEDAAPWQRRLLRGGLFVGLVLLTVAAFPRGDFYEYTVEVGDTWRQSTLTAPFNFPVYLDEDRVQARRDTVRKKTPPYFQAQLRAPQKLSENRDTLQRQLDRILGAYVRYRTHRSAGERDAAERDSLEYIRRRRNALVTLSEPQWGFLATQFLQGQQATGAPPTPEELTARLYERLLGSAYEIGGQLLSAGVLDRPRDSIATDHLIVRNEREQTQRRVEKGSLYGLNEAFEFAEQRLEQEIRTREEARIAYAFFRAIFEPSLHYLRQETMQERDRRAQSVTPIQGGVEVGEPIVRKGEQVTADIKRMLTSLERARKDRLGPTIVWKKVGGEVLYTLLGFGFFFFYLYLLRPEIWGKLRDLVLISVILGIIVVLFGVVIRLPWSLYAVPVALASVLFTIIFNSRIALIGTLLLAFTGGQMLGLDLEYSLATFFAGAFGIFSVRDIKNRGQFFVSGGLVFVGYVLVLAATWLYMDLPLSRVAPDLAYAAVASAITVTSSLFLWGVERIFDITTDLTLLELSDTNRPLLKNLSLRAPGSFNHSLQVANLAEAAADRVGAHMLLTRVGALYHDIGKMKNPEYFVENQRTMTNPHEDLKPRMSALIIASHVKEGLEMGREEGLPEQVLKFVPMHHGTARIDYFYQKAVSRADGAVEDILESEFRYPGPTPDSKETGILMLADSIEAASRSLDDPSPRQLENLIDQIFSDRIDDGQLEDTDLTFRDLRLVKDTFLKMLLGIYHVRVKYPDQEEGSEGAVLAGVSLHAEQPYVHVSIVKDRDAWAKRFWLENNRLQPARDPRPQLATMSPLSQIHAAPSWEDAPPTTQNAPEETPDEASSSTHEGG